MHANKYQLFAKDESESKQGKSWIQSEREDKKYAKLSLRQARKKRVGEATLQRTSSLNDEVGFAGSDRGMTILRMTVFSGASVGVETAPISDTGPPRLLGTPVRFPSAKKQSRTLLPATDLAVLAVSEGAEVSLSLPAAAAAVCVATSAAGFDSADVLLMEIADPAEAESKRIDRITNNHATQQAKGGDK